MSIYTQKTTQYLLLSSIFATALLLSSFFFSNVALASGNVSGYAWGATDSNGNNVFTPGVDGGPGWISFNCADNTDCSVDYGVDVDLGTEENPGTGIFSGHMWSGVEDSNGNFVDGLGYVTFDIPALGGCPVPVGNSCTPRISNIATLVADDGIGNIVGWARACSVFVQGCSGTLRPLSERGGWDGWIELSGTNHPTGDVYSDHGGVTLDLFGVNNNGEAQIVGFAWGGNTNDGSNVAGWINFGVPGGSTTGCQVGCSPVTDLWAVDPLTQTNEHEDITIPPDTSLELGWWTFGETSYCNVYATGFDTDNNPTLLNNTNGFTNWYTTMSNGNIINGSTSPDQSLFVPPTYPGQNSTSFMPPQGYDHIDFSLECSNSNYTDTSTVTVHFTDIIIPDDIFNISLLADPTTITYPYPNPIVTDLSWTAVPGNNIVADYCVGTAEAWDESNQPIQSPVIPGWTDVTHLPPPAQTLTVPVPYSRIKYTIVCYDVAGNSSPPSFVLVSIEPPDVPVPSVSCSQLNGFVPGTTTPYVPANPNQTDLNFDYTSQNVLSCTTTITNEPPITIDGSGQQHVIFNISVLPTTVTVTCTPIPISSGYAAPSCGYTLNQTGPVIGDDSGPPVFEEF